MTSFFSVAMIAISIYLLLSVVLFVGCMLTAPKIVQACHLTVQDSESAPIFMRIIYLSAAFGLMLLIGVGAYHLLFWMPNMAYANADWRMARFSISLFFGGAVGLFVFSFMADQASHLR